MDIVQTALVRAAAPDSLTYLLAAGAGIVTSVGPCVAPRYLAVASMGGQGRRGAYAIAAFVAGTLVAYLSVAAAGSFIMHLVGASPIVYGVLAAALIASGVRALVRGHHSCDHAPAPLPLGGAFFLGVISSIVIAPCCTPVLIAFGSLTAGAQSCFVLVGLVVAFTIGHLAPVALAACGGTVFAGVLSRQREAVATINAGVWIALGAYYAVLA